MACRCCFQCNSEPNQQLNTVTTTNSIHRLYWNQRRFGTVATFTVTGALRLAAMPIRLSVCVIPTSYTLTLGKLADRLETTRRMRTPLGSYMMAGVNDDCAFFVGSHPSRPPCAKFRRLLADALRKADNKRAEQAEFASLLPINSSKADRPCGYVARVCNE